MAIDLKDYDTSMMGLGRGDTVRVNHEGCSAGRDTKKRLYITRVQASANVVVAYCHNCQDSGVHKEVFEMYRDYKDSSNVLQYKKVPFSPPTGLITDPKLWPNAATGWRLQKGLSNDECEKHKIAYDPASHRVYLPMYKDYYADIAQQDADLLGYQLRQIDNRGPKYLTALRDQSTIPSTLLSYGTSISFKGSLAYIVEDLASGIALYRGLMRARAGGRVLVNYGVKVSPTVLDRVKEFNQGVVWLDNDGLNITDQAEKLMRVWSMISGNQIKIEYDATDPKTLSSVEMADKIKDHRWRKISSTA